MIDSPQSRGSIASLYSGELDWMWLLDTFLRKIIRTGRLVVTDHDGKVYEYGPGPETMEHRQPMHVRLTNKKASSHIARYPDRKSTRLNSSHVKISYAVFCLK